MTPTGGRSPYASPTRRRPADRFPGTGGTLHGGFSLSQHSDSDEEEAGETLRSRVAMSGAVPLAEAEIFVVTDKDTFQGAITKERVPFVSGGALDRLIVNVLLVVYVP